MKRRNFIGAMTTGLAVAPIGAFGGARQTARVVDPAVVNVKDFGAAGDGVADDTAAVQAAIDACPAGGGIVLVPPGVYALSAALNLRPRVAIQGAGSASRLSARTTGMDVLRYLAAASQAVDISIADLEIECGTTAQVSGIVMRFARSVTIRDVTFSGCLFTVSLDRCRSVNISDCLSRGLPNLKGGTLRIYSSTADANAYSFEVKVNNYHAYNIGNGFSNGHAIIVNRGVAVLIAGFTLNDGHNGGDIHGVGFYGDCQGCKVSSSVLAAGSSGVFFGADLYTNDPIVPSFCTVTDVDVDQPQVAGVWIAAGNWITVDGGHITASGVNLSAQGLLAQAGSRITVTGLTVHGFSQAGNGVLLGSNVSHATVASCQVESCGTGIGVVAGAGDYLSITGNRLTGNSIPLNFGASGANCLVRMNLGAADRA